MSVAELRDRLEALRGEVADAAVAAGVLELGSDTVMDHWSLRGAEVRLQAAADLVHGAAATLTAQLHRLEPAAPSPIRPFSDWVRACEVSRLGKPTSGLSSRGWALFFGEDIYVDFDQDSETLRAFVEVISTETALTCATPDDLTAALNRLAEERR